MQGWDDETNVVEWLCHKRGKDTGRYDQLSNNNSGIENASENIQWYYK